MKDQSKTKPVLIQELASLRKRMEALEQSESERKGVSEALPLNEENFREIFDRASDGILIADATTKKFIQGNTTICSMLGYTEEEINSLSLYDIHPPKDISHVVDEFEKQARGVKVLAEDLPVLRKDRSVFYADISSTPITIGGRNCIFGIFRDITERKRTRKELQELSSRQEAILAAIPDIIVEVDNNKIYTWANSEGIEFFGEDMISKDASFYFEGEQDTYDKVTPLFSGAEDIIYLESWQRRKDGERRLLAWWCRVLKDEKGSVTGALSSARDITERKRAVDEMAILAEIVRVIGSTLEIDKVYEQMAAEIRKVILFDSLVVNLFNAKQETLHIAYVSGMDIPDRKMGDVFPAKGTLAEEAVRTRKGVIVQSENPEEFADKFPSLIISIRAGIHSVMSVPLIAQDEVIGNLIMRSKKPVAYSEKDLHLAEKIGMEISGAIANARLFSDLKQSEQEHQQTIESLRRAFGTTVRVMVSAVETRDPYTSGHQTRSADLARAIATEMGLPQENIDAIRIAGTIHDIGKLSIPAEILSKPTKLSEIEFSLIKEHARKGYEMLKDVESPWPLAEIVHQHHERMDGSGYPRNLKGEDICIEARILAVADVMEAMASHRPYRPAIGIDAALQEIEKNRGVFYDDAVVDACLRLFREKGFQLAGA